MKIKPDQIAGLRTLTESLFLFKVWFPFRKSVLFFKKFCPYVFSFSTITQIGFMLITIKLGHAMISNHFGLS